MENNKKWYKKWWVIALIVLAVVMVIPVSEESSSAAESESTTENETTTNEETTNEETTDEETTDEKSKDNEKISLVINGVSDCELTQVEALTVEEGERIVDVDITITNNKVSDGLNMNPLYFEAETPSYSGITSSIFVTDDNAPTSGVDIKEGVSQDYVLTFSIPEGEEIISVTYDNMFLSVTSEV